MSGTSRTALGPDVVTVQLKSTGELIVLPDARAHRAAPAPASSSSALAGGSCPDDGGPHHVLTLELSLHSGASILLHSCHRCSDRSWEHLGQVIDREQMLAVLTLDAITAQRAATSQAALPRVRRVRTRTKPAR